MRVSTGPAPQGDAHLKPLCYPIRKPLPWLPCTSLSDEPVLTVSRSAAPTTHGCSDPRRPAQTFQG
ncbi:rCG20750 [Rattus norvegicus]|uniref:RCG20750 n=1 Tax=Rattus norvegicus TaxID=10116 RepID=A6JDJ9_RAT|nr:rCG20750 [Rattus norvegicus]